MYWSFTPGRQFMYYSEVCWAVYAVAKRTVHLSKKGVGKNAGKQIHYWREAIVGFWDYLQSLHHFLTLTSFNGQNLYDVFEPSVLAL